MMLFISYIDFHNVILLTYCGTMILHFSFKIWFFSATTVVFFAFDCAFQNLKYASSLVHYVTQDVYQRWSPRGRPWPRGRPRGHILKSLALASKVKSLALASRPQVLENWPVLGSKTTLFFELLKFCGTPEKFFGKRFFVEIA